MAISKVDVQSAVIQNPGFEATAQDVRNASRPSIRSSSRWVVLGTVISRPLQLVTTILVARLLGPAGFGLVGLAGSLAVTLSLIAGLGLGDGVNKYLSEHYEKDRAKAIRYGSVIFWTAFLFTLTLLAALWLTQSVWGSRVFPSSTSSRLFGLSLLLALGNLLTALLVGMFSGLQRFREFTILSLIQVIGAAVFGLSLVSRGSEGVVLGFALGTLLSILWGIGKLWKLERGILAWPGLSSFVHLKEILGLSIPIWIGAIAFPPFFTFTLAFLAHQTAGPFQLGLFNTANGLRMLIALIPGAIAVVIAPSILREGGAHGQRETYLQLIHKSFSALIFLTLSVLIPALFLSDLILKLYGRAFDNAFVLFVPLTASAAVGAIGGLLPTVMLAKNRTWWGFIFGLLKSALMVGLAVMWVPRFFGQGLSWAVVISEIAIYVAVLEFCIFIDALPGAIRTTFYSSILIVLALMGFAIFAPPILRWALALPLTVAVVVYYLRSDSQMGNWLTSFVPDVFKPGAQRVLSFIAPSPVQHV